MQFQVPQFIEVEDKIFGPFTFKQFIYLAGGAGLSVLLYLFLPGFISWLLILPVVGLSLALTFYKVNNRPFSLILESAIKYALTNKLYVWKKETKQPKGRAAASEQKEPLANMYVPRLSDSKLKDLAWSLDVQQPKTRDDNTT